MKMEGPAVESLAADYLARAAACLQRARDAGRESAPQGLRFGIDLGTATIVLCAVDATGEPVYWDFVRKRVVRDGVVVDFAGAADAVLELKERAEAALGQAVDAAATAHPPGVPAADCRACIHVVERAGIDCRLLTDEVSAAQALLKIDDGVICDVGGGSTGVGRVRDGRIVSLSDRPGGGHYLDLILAGALGISIDEAEAMKREGTSDVMGILRPGIERIAEVIGQQCEPGSTEAVHLAGGALMVAGADRIVERYLGRPVVAYPHANLITPFGIACS